MEAVQKTIARLEGAFAIAVVSADNPYELIVARQQAPLVLGFGQGEFFCASDMTAILPHTRTVLNLENGEMARLTPLGVEIYNFKGDRISRFPPYPRLESRTGGKTGFPPLYAQGNLRATSGSTQLPRQLY